MRFPDAPISSLFVTPHLTLWPFTLNILRSSHALLQNYPAINMGHTRGLVSSAQALRQIFVTPGRISRAGILPNTLRNGVQIRFFQQSHFLSLREYRPPIQLPPKN